LDNDKTPAVVVCLRRGEVPMRFVYNAEKTAQAAAYLLRHGGGTMNSSLLAGLLYLADRVAFVESGYPITGATMVSMESGPLLSEVYQALLWDDNPESPWNRLITPASNYHVGLRAGSAELEHLSEYDEEILQRVADRYGRWERLDLGRFMRQLPEWTESAGQPIPIDVRTILREAGKSESEIQAVAGQVEAIYALEHTPALTA
jgi:hypothetical protein